MDNARKKTDKQLAKMEKYLKKMYSDSQKGIREKWDIFMSEMEKRIDGIEQQLQSARLTKDKKSIEELEYEKRRLIQNMTFGNNHYKEMVRQTAEKITHVNEEAIAYLNGQMHKIYSINYNQVATDVEIIKGYQFEMMNDNTIKYMIDNDIDFAPKRVVDRHRDIAWNKKNINSQVMQGILQGDTIGQLTKRIVTVVGINEASAKRQARTMTTQAECGGRMDSYKRVESDGIVMKKEWIATHDARVRSSHIKQDGELRDNNETFSNGLMFPGDPRGRAEEIYNCRCSICAEIIGFVGRNGKINYVDKSFVKNNTRRIRVYNDENDTQGHTVVVSSTKAKKYADKLYKEALKREKKSGKK